MKQMVFFWGNTPMSWLRFITIKTFRLLHPDWDVKLFTAKTNNETGKWRSIERQDFFNYTKRSDYLDKISGLGIPIVEWKENNLPNIGPSHLSNLFKWKILHTQGGVYADMDIVFIRSINKLYKKLVNYDAGLTYAKYFSIGVLFGKQNNALFKMIYNHSLRVYDPQKYQCVGVLAIYHLLHGDNIYKNDEDIDWMKTYSFNNFKLLSQKTNSSIYNVPMHLFYYFNSGHIEDMFLREKRIPDTTLGIHWYAGNSLSQKYNNLLTEDNWHKYSCTLTNQLRKIL